MMKVIEIQRERGREREKGDRGGGERRVTGEGGRAVRVTHGHPLSLGAWDGCPGKGKGAE